MEGEEAKITAIDLLFGGEPRTPTSLDIEEAAWMHAVT